jgi:hypothetical protein
MKFTAKFLTSAYQDAPHSRYDAPSFEEWRESLQFPITIYRGLGLDDPKKIRTTSTGVYWSTQKSTSEGFAQMSADEFGHEHYGVLTGVLDSEDDVDWDDVEANWSAGPEFELLLLSGTQIRDVQISIDGGAYRPFKKSITASKVAFPKTHTISLQEAQDRKLFGPVYHGTTEDRRGLIDDEGFKVFEGDTGSGDIKHGYQSMEYSSKYPGVPPPVHHLGFGVYFTTSPSIAKQFSYGTTAGMKTYYLDIPNHETINFAAPNTMMKWWVDHGYDPALAKTDRVAATKQLTQNLKPHGALIFKGKTMFKALDGQQVCVYDANLIFEIDPSLSQAGEVGSKVKRKADGMKGTLLKRESLEGILERYPGASSWIKPEAKYRLTVKWQKGGTDANVQDVDVEFL